MIKTKHAKRSIIAIIIVAVIALAGVLAAVIWFAADSGDQGAVHTDNNQSSTNQDNQGSTPANGETITVEGEYVCLPKEGDGPQTLECALGLSAADGTYYALDFTQLMGGDPTAAGAYNTGDQLRITGTYEAHESIYLSEGVITVESVEEQ